MHRLQKNAILCWLLLGMSSPVRAQESALQAEVRALWEKYQTRIQEISEEGLDGGFKSANAKLVDLTKKEKSPAMIFLVGNLLYSVDPEKSYALHKQVYDAKPNEALVVLEWAMEKHRKGEYAEAIPLYGQYIKAVPADNVKSALLADCLVRTGKLKEAVTAWNGAMHPQFHTEIDFAIFEIYGGLSPARRRSDLLDQIRGGNSNIVEHLIALDLHYDQDWWNSSVNQRALKADMELASRILGKESRRYQELDVYSKLGAAETSSPESVKSTLSASGLLLGDKGRLPENSLVAQALVEKSVQAGAEAKDQFLARYENELVRRAHAKPGDSDALNLLCYLYVDVNADKLAESDRYGWEHYGEARFAASYIAGMARKKALTPESPELAKAVKQFPENGIIRGLQIQAIGKDNLSTEVIVAAIKAEYRKLSPGLAIVDSYTLKGLFHRLENQTIGGVGK